MNTTSCRLRWMASLAILTVLLGVWLTAVLLLQNSLRTALHDAELRNTGQAQAFAEYSSSVVKRIDEFMLDTRDLWDGNWESFAVVVKRRQANISDLAFQVGVIGKDGFLEFSNLSKPQEITDLRDRAHFQVHKLAPEADKLFISSPVKGKVSGKWAIQFSRPMFKDGRFDGVLVASISPDLLAAFNAKLGGDKNRSVTIVNATGAVLARYPELASALGQKIKDAPFLTANAPVSGSYRRIGSLDQEDRLFGYYRTPEYGLNFVIGASIHSVMTPYRQSRQLIISVAAAISGLLCVFWLIVFRALAALEKTRQHLVQARDRADLASKTKSQFLANMSHEIRTPMNAILGLLRLLKTTELSAQQADYAGKTEGAARSLLRLIEDILDLSKIEAHKLVLDPHPFLLARMLDSVALILSANLIDKALTLRFAVDPSVPLGLYGDDLRLQQVLLNIGGNAIKFSQQGEILIRVQRLDSGADPSTARLEFSVRDDGIGIAEENQHSIFNSFTQADASTTRRFGGTGLGLSISSRIVALLGGELKLSSALGLGSRFYFQLNMTVAAEPPVIPVPSMLAAPVLTTAGAKLPIKPLTTLTTLTNNLTDGGNPQGRLSGLRLLLIEDNEINQLVAHGLLSLEGADITLASNGQLGLDAIRSQPAFDAVLIDLQMPVMDGYAATQAIRQQLGLQQLPVIAMTANAMPTDRAACLDAGMNDHVGKPFDLDQLVATLLRWTAR